MKAPGFLYLFLVPVFGFSYAKQKGYLQHCLNYISDHTFGDEWMLASGEFHVRDMSVMSGSYVPCHGHQYRVKGMSAMSRSYVPCHGHQYRVRGLSAMSRSYVRCHGYQYRVS